MKVYIGPYVYTWVSQVHHKYMCNKYDCMWEDNKDWKDAAMEKLEDALQLIYNYTINLYLKRKNRDVRVKIHNYDTWGMDETLAHIVVPMLKQLKATKHGAPMTDQEDRPDHLKSDELDPVDMTDKYHFEAWDWILDAMIWAFEQKTVEWEAQYYGEWIEDESKTLGGYFKNRDNEGMKAHGARMSNGFRLFGKYYEALWD